MLDTVMAPDTGDYLIRFYDAKGRADKALDRIFPCLTDAITYGSCVIKTGAANSYSVDRRVMNSLDEISRWTVDRS